ncbi:MAG: GNAT family N-acetyltransferase [Dehalococcoidales bacterium]|nr:MAG: GNAT family N-acetyltransferase [Dehalococcoidales bacterium]
MITNIVDLDEHDISHIRNMAEQEGYNMLNRLVTDYNSGENQFDKEGEKLIGYIADDIVVALCGLNIESTNNKYGRIRRLYVLPEYRNRGIGTELVSHFITFAGKYYKGIVVNIGNLSVSAFYESKGFHPVNNPSYTHLQLF